MLTYLFRIIRPVNLAIIGILMYMIRWCIAWPFLEAQRLNFYLDDLAFFILCLSTLLIAAGGYVINDYFDRNIDAINKPDRLIIGKHIASRTAISIHLILSVFGFFLGGTVAIIFEVYSLILIQLAAVLLLWYYSLRLKRQFLIGNASVALLSAIIPFIAGIYEFKASEDIRLFNMILLYFFFSFLMTFIRELIKDAEDVAGDKEYNCNTFPVKYGIKKTIYFINGCILLLVLTLALTQYFAFQHGSSITMGYILCGLQLPLLFLAIKTSKNKAPQDFSYGSRLAKFIMLFGICYGPVFFFINTL